MLEFWWIPSTVKTTQLCIMPAHMLVTFHTVVWQLHFLHSFPELATCPTFAKQSLVAYLTIAVTNYVAARCSCSHPIVITCESEAISHIKIQNGPIKTTPLCYQLFVKQKEANAQCWIIYFKRKLFSHKITSILSWNVKWLIARFT